jgi:poly-gamma-glutamate capsule biosynthesis protein CapA/YwtB (metallophosphatase superfamily)
VAPARLRWLVAGGVAVFFAALALSVVAGLRVSVGAAGVGKPPATKPKPKPRVVRRLAPPPAEVTVVAVGDLTFGRGGVSAPGGAQALFARVRGSLQGDLVVGNLETTLGTGLRGKCLLGATGCYSFQAPPSFARGLQRVGFDVLNVANNHANDYGLAGRAQTRAALAKAGLRSTGRPGQIAIVRAGTIRVALVGLAPYPWAQDLLDVPAAQALVRRASRQADVVVAMLHIGAEGSGHEHVRPGMESYLGERRGDPLLVGHALVNAGADLVLGSGPHVLRGLELYRGRLIAYSLGNFSGYHTLSTSGLGGISAILRARVDRSGRIEGGRLVPVHLVGAGAPQLDRSAQAVRLVARLGREDFGAHAVKLLRDGTLALGPRRAPGPQRAPR